jgi:hypothetical protein
MSASNFLSVGCAMACNPMLALAIGPRRREYRDLRIVKRATTEGVVPPLKSGKA